MRALAAALLLACAGAAAAADLPGVPGGLREPGAAGWLTFGAGLAIPAGGHWGDTGSGFKPSGAVSAAVARKLDDTYSWGVDGSCAFAHRYRKDGSFRVGLGSLEPFYRITVPRGSWRLYGLFGAGLYFWRTAAPLPADSGSGSSAGFSLGFGGARRLTGGLDGGFELRWHHILDMDGPGLDLGAADNVALMLTVSVPTPKRTP